MRTKIQLTEFELTVLRFAICFRFIFLFEQNRMALSCAN